jgi:DNA-binding MarR family transcriptional regulator
MNGDDGKPLRGFLDVLACCGVLEQLGRSDASITDLAEKFHMTLTGMKKHVGVLEQAGLVTTEKVGRVRLDMVVEELKRKEKHQ